MNSVKMNRKELLKIVKDNQKKHVTEYNESVEDYKTGVAKLAKANLKLANSGDLTQIASMKKIPTAPVSYEDNYTRAIRMLELSVEDVIECVEIFLSVNFEGGRHSKRVKKINKIDKKFDEIF